MQFDVRAAKALKPGDHLIVPGAPGLRLEAGKTARTWIYRYKSPVDDRMKQVRLGRWPTMSVAQAAVAWDAARAERAGGKDAAQEKRDARNATPAPSIPTPVACQTVGDLVDGYVEWAAKRRATRGGAELRRTMAAALDDATRALQVEDVSRTVAFDFVHRFSDTPVQASNLRRELGAAWEWGHDSGRIADTVPNWWRLVLRGKLRSKGKIIRGEHQGVSKRVLSVAEVGAVLRHLPNLTLVNVDLLTLYLWTGCRGAEIVQMEGSELSEDDAGVLWWTIPKAKLKMARHELAMDLPVPLVGRAREIALRRREAHGDRHLFPPARGKALHVEQKSVGVAVWTHLPSCTLRPEWERPRWPVDGWSPHDLRRTVRTQLARLGCEHAIGEAVLGHIDSDADVYDRHDYRAERLHWITQVVQAWEQAASR